MGSRKKHSVIYKAALSLIALYFIVDIFGGYMLERMVENRLGSYLVNTQDRLYDLSYRTFEISMADRAVRLGKIKITPRLNAIDSMKHNQLSMLIAFEADSFYFEGLSIFKLLVLNNVKLDKIVGKRPTVKIYLNSKAKVSPKKSNIPNNIISNKLKSGFIHKFDIATGNFYIINFNNRDSIYFKLNSSSLSVRDVSIKSDVSSLIDKVSFESFHFSSGQLYGGFPEHYTIKADSINLDRDTRKMSIKNFSFTPKDFTMTNKKVQFAHDVTNVEVDNITIRDISFKGNDNFKGYYSSKIELSRLNFALSTDKRLPKNMNAKPLIGELVKKVKIPYCIDTIEITDSRIFYNEIVSTEKTPLKVLFTSVDLNILNTTNAESILNINPDLKITGSTKFLDAGDLDFKIDVPLTAKEDNMIVSCHLGAMPLEPVNRMLEAPLSVRLTSGKINSIDINFVSDTKHSTGELKFDYSNLTVKIFKDKETAKRGIKEKNKWFMNIIANGIVKKNNNKESEKFVTGVIDYERPKDIGIPGYLFRSVKSGLISTFKPGTRRKAIKGENKANREINKKEKKAESKKRKTKSKN